MKARVPAPVMRFGARQLGRRCLNPALPWPTQRTRLNQLTGLGPLPRGTRIESGEFGGVACEIV
ncbi:MAG TPA: hypothetical protein VKU39_20335, partial [Streptosporangiaceae bacterium]|nr:hypothetical protein [Streptosporangiaceae bacterium]